MSLRKKINSTYTPAEAWGLCFGVAPPSGKCFCPFHDNRHSPAAKLYPTGLHCFGECNKTYDSYDLLKRFNPTLLQTIKETYILEEAPLESQEHTSSNFIPQTPLEEYYGY